MHKLIPLAAFLGVGLLNVASAHAALPIGRIVSGGCLKSIDLHKDWNKDLVSFDDDRFSVGVGASANLTGDCNKIEASVAGSMRAKVYGVSGLKPFDVEFTASTNNAHHSAVTLSIYMLGYKIDDFTLAETDQALQGGDTFGLMIPSDQEHHHAEGSLHIPGTDYTASYSIGFDVVGNVAGLYSYSAQPSYVKALVWGQLQSKAHFTVSGQAGKDNTGIGIKGDAMLNLLSGTVQGFGEFKQVYKAPPKTAFFIRPINPPRPYNAWQVTGRAGYSIDGGLSGKLTAHFSADIGHGQTLTYDHDFFKIKGLTPAADNWEYTQTYDKPFN